MNDAQDGSSSSHIRLVEYIEEQLQQLPVISDKCCIYRVPKLLRSVNPEAYTPTAVPIGPLHQEDFGHSYTSVDAPDFFRNGLYKLKCLKSFLDQTQVELKDFLVIVSSKKAEIAAYYARTVNIYKDEDLFCDMILLDSIFIIQFIRDNIISQEDRDSIWMSPLTVKEIGRDIMLAENQIPFFILDDLFKKAFTPLPDPDLDISLEEVTDRSFLKVACKALNIYVDYKYVPCHLLDMFRMSLLRTPSGNGTSFGSNEGITCPTATALYESGVELEVNRLANGRLLEIEFDAYSKTLMIPKLKVGDDTEVMFRNLIAYEQSRNHKEVPHITGYLFFLDCLINTPNDVQLLTKAGIIENWLGSEKSVCDLINSLGKHSYNFSGGYFYADLANQLNSFHGKRMNRYIAILKQVYFSHPWAIIAVVYAALLLLLTIIQATGGSILDIIDRVAQRNKN